MKGIAPCSRDFWTFQRLQEALLLSMAMKVVRGSVFGLNMTLPRDVWFVTPCKLDLHEKFSVNVKDKLVEAKTVEWFVVTDGVCT